MPAVLLKNVPPQLHRRLKQQAAQNRRSMAQETLLVLERALAIPGAEAAELPAPVKSKRPLSDRWLKTAVRRGRA